MDKHIERHNPADSFSPLTAEQVIYREELIDALRSGKYKQTRHQLANDGIGIDGLVYGYSFCCLGLACLLAGESPSTLKCYKLPQHRSSFHGRYGFTDRGIEIDVDDYNKESTSLAKENDEGVSFSEIADMIEFDMYMRGVEA